MSKFKLLSVLPVSVFIATLFIFPLSHANADITIGLVSHWKLDETSGTTATDSTGTNNGTVSGATFTTGKINNGLSIPATALNQQVSVTDPVSSNLDFGTGSFSVSMWGYFRSYSSGSSPAKGWFAVGKGDSCYTSGNTGWSIGGGFYDATALAVCYRSGTTGNRSTIVFDPGYRITDTLNKWTHLVVVFDKTNNRVKAYVNGVKQTNEKDISAVTGSISNSANLRIGYVDGWASDAIYDDVRVYSRALTATDISQLYNYTGTGASSSSFQIQPQSAPTATTNSATSITSTSATLNGTVNPNNQSTTVYFQYGLTSSSYGNQTPTQTLTGSTNQNITANIANLTANTLYYYRTVATNNSGTAYGTQMSFTTSSVQSSSSSITQTTDLTPPTVSITSPTTNTTYTTSASTISLSGTASDNVSVSSVTCTVNGSSCGTVSGTTSWSVSSIPLSVGTNTIIVTARDAVNNISTKTLTVTRTSTISSSSSSQFSSFSSSSGNFSQVWQQVRKRTKAQKTAGLSGGEGMQAIVSIAYAPSNPNIAYFVTDTHGVWKSTNGGTSWQRKAGEYPTSGGISIVVDPTNENIVYAAGSVMSYGDVDTSKTVEGIIRTADGGDTWTLVKQAHFHKSAAFGKHFDFAGTNIYAAPSTGGILKSTNGTTWNLLNKSGGGYVLDTLKLYNIKAHPTNNTILFASATNGLHKIVDVNGSATVTKIGTGLPAGAVYQVQIDKNNPNIMYAAVGTNGVYRSTDGGLNFSPRNNGLSSPISSGGSARWLAMAPTNSNRLFVTFQNIFGKHLYYTNDSGANWTQTSTMDEQNADGWVSGSLYGYTTDLSGINNLYAPLAFHPTNQDIALVTGLGSHIKKTTDGGVTWKYSNTGYIGTVIGSRSVVTPIGWDATNANRAVYSHSDIGSLITEDNEDTFKYIATVSWNGRKATPAAAMQGSIIVEAVGQTNDNDQFHALAVSRNSGSSWTILGSAIGNFVFISFHPQNSNIVYAGKYKFTDIQNSNTYTTLIRDVKGIFKGNGDIVYSYSGNTVYKSTDGGATWATPYPSLNLPAGSYVRQIAIDSTNQNRIYVAASFQGVYIITDTVANGGTVQIKNDANGIAKDANNWICIESVATDPNDENVVYAGATNTGWSGPANGVFRSTDRGATWVNINGNLGSYLNTLTLTVNPFNSYVYLGSFAGTWKLPPPGTVSTTDTTPPSVSIASPTTSTTYSTAQSAVALSGTASDNVGVTSVTCLNNGISCGTASNTTSWSVSNIPLTVGTNSIVITAKDGKANTSTDTLTVTRTTTSSSSSISQSSSSSVQSSSSSIPQSSSSSIQSSSSSSSSLPTLTTTAKKTLSTITTDGNLNESVWSLTDSINRTISGVNNNTATFSTLWNNQYLYVAVKVLDSVLKNDSTYPYMDDSVEVYIDAGHNHSTTYDTNDRQIIKGQGDSTAVSFKVATPNLIHGTTPITGGYTMEFAIPWSNLGITPSSNMTIGFDLQQNDDDTGGDVQSAKGWNSTTGKNYTTTLNFGHLTLSATTVGTLPSSSSSSAPSSSSSLAQSSSSSLPASSSSSSKSSSSQSSVSSSLSASSSSKRTGKPSGVKNLRAKKGSVILEWDVVNTDEFIQKILIYRSSSNYPQNSDTSSLISTLSDINQTSYHDTNVSDNITYYYSVFTVDDSDTFSDVSTISFYHQKNGGGTTGGGGGGGGSNTGTITPVTPYTQTITPTAQSSSSSSASSYIPPFSATVTTKTVTGPFSIGMRSEQVKVLQQMLSSDSDIYPEGSVTGYYGPATTRAVKRFQKKYNIEQTGLAGIQTRAKLNEVYGQTTSSQSSSQSESQTYTSSSSYYFTKELRYGSKGNDVTELQNRLTSEGIYSGPITGYYGTMTREAVKKYQTQNNLPPVGAVGPKTLELLNGSSSSSSSNTTTSSSQGLTLRDLVELLISLGVISPDKADLARTSLQTMEGR